jgi:hypothetical protein
MDVGRLCKLTGTKSGTAHQRIAEYVKPLIERYHGMGFAPREEWVVEQTIEGLRRMLADTRCTDEERRAIEEFLGLASEELAGAP